MHACNTLTVDQLLSLRDGALVDASAKIHAERCPLCSQELARLTELQTSMRTLPLLTPPAYDAKAIRARARWTSPRIATLAAASIGAFTLAFVMSTFDATQRDAGSQFQPIVASQESASQTESELPVNALVIRSQELESLLQQLPRRPSVQRASTSATIESLHSGIQWVDYQLSLANEAGLTNEEAAQLWEKRVELMDSLVMVRYAEAERAAYVNVSALH